MALFLFFCFNCRIKRNICQSAYSITNSARDMASPFINMLSYRFFFAASVVIFSSLFVETGPSQAEWTAYPPVSALGGASSGSKTGIDFWLIAMALFIVSQLLAGINYISTILNMCTKGMSMVRLPLTIWALLFTAILGVFSFPVLLSGGRAADLRP